jgi:hypothetical protein
MHDAQSTIALTGPVQPMSIIRLIISVLVSVPIAQGIWLLVAGFFGEKFIGPLALLALPMTLAFFGLPACPVPCDHRGDILWPDGGGAPPTRSDHLAVCGSAWMAYLLVAKPTPSGAFPGYDQTLQFNVAGVWVVWAAYAHSRLAFKSDSVRQVLKP